MKPPERNEKIRAVLDDMYQAAKTATVVTPYDEMLEQIVVSKDQSYREVLLCIISHMLIDPNLKASTNWYAFHPRGIYDAGPVKQFLTEYGIPHTKSGPLNITKAANINPEWAERRASPEVAHALIDIVKYVESHNSIKEMRIIGISLIQKLLREAIRVQQLSVNVAPSNDPIYLANICIQLINNVPDFGNTPQQVAARLLENYHWSTRSEICVTGGKDRASVTSTTSHKPGDINEELYNHILKVYEITVKAFDKDRIIDSYDCIEKFNQCSENQISEVIVICRPQDCPSLLQQSGFSNYMGFIDFQNIRYHFWNIYEWIMSILQQMPNAGREHFTVSLASYVNDINTAEAVKIEWHRLQGIE